jgi:hypothetical protein
MQRAFIDMPTRIGHLPRDHRGFPVPKFVQWFDAAGTPCNPGTGTPDFRVVDSRWVIDCVNHSRCWLCGGQLGKHKAFVIGPMCAVNRINSEPPSHYQCARFAARNCPFMIRPRMRRNDKGLDDYKTLKDAPGIPLDRNPGACAVWTCETYRPFKANGGILFDLGEPSAVEFWSEARPASYAEVLASVESGLPALYGTIALEPASERPAAKLALEASVERFHELLKRFPPEGMPQ